MIPVEAGWARSLARSFLVLPVLCAPPLFAGVNVWTTHGPEGESVTALAALSSTPATLYAGTSGGRVYRSRDGGESWSPSGIGLSNRPVTALAIDPCFAPRVFAGTAGAGLFVTPDAGDTWVQSNAGLTDLRVRTIVFEPFNCSAFIATDGGLFQGFLGNWIRSGAGLPFAAVSAVARATSPFTLFAATQGAGVFRSTNFGFTWFPVTSGLTDPFVLALAVSKSDPDVVFAGTSTGVFRSLDRGTNWSRADSGIGNRAVTALLIGGQTPLTAYAGTAGRGVFRTLDGGESWSPFNTGLTDPFVHVLASDSSARFLFAATPSGVFDRQISPSCRRDSEHLCLLDGRFRVSVDAADPRSFRFGAVLGFSIADRSGYFTLPAVSGGLQPEITVKMIDATSRSGSFWFFHSALTDIPYVLTVLDTQSGAIKTYRSVRSDSSAVCGAADTAAFSSSAALTEPDKVLEEPAPASPASWFSDSVGAATGVCLTTPTALCMLNRFLVSVTAEDPRTGRSEAGRGFAESGLWGYFSLPGFTRDLFLPEILFKFVDARSLPGRFYWLFHSGLTDLQYTLTVTDTVTGETKVYRNERSDPSRLCGGADTSAFQ